MENLRRLTDTINTFVRFFQSINCLFWNLQWLEENLMKASNPRMLIVGGIILFCVFYTFMGDSIGDTTDPMVLLIVVCVLAWVLYRRYQARIVEGSAFASHHEEEQGVLIQHGIVIDGHHDDINDLERGTEIPTKGKR